MQPAGWPVSATSAGSLLACRLSAVRTGRGGAGRSWCWADCSRRLSGPGARLRRTPRSRRRQDGSRRTRSSTARYRRASHIRSTTSTCRLVSAFTRSEIPTAMRCMMLFSDGGRDGEIRRACQVDHVERDDARVRGAGANARDQVFEIGAPLPDLRVDVAVDVVAAAARERRAADHVGVVAAGEDRHVRACWSAQTAPAAR